MLSLLEYSPGYLSLSELSLYGALNHVVVDAIEKHVLGLALLVTYSVFATVMWKSAAISSLGAGVIQCFLVTGRNPRHMMLQAKSIAFTISVT